TDGILLASDAERDGGGAVGRPALDIRSGDDRHSTVLSECQVAQCCPEGLTIIEGGDGSDVLLGGSNPECLVGLDGDDALHAGSDGDVLLGGDGADLLRGGSANDVIAGGPGPDDIDAGSGDDEIRGGAGADVIDAGSGNDIVDAGSGDDTITGGSGHDIIVPGPGLDTVIAGGGDDTVIVYDPCELEPGESYAGGSGFDTLVLPVPLHEVEALGVTVMGFEQVIVDP